MDYALRAFINCYRDLDRNEAESIKIEVMTELTGVSGCIPRNRCKSTNQKKKKKKKKFFFCLKSLLNGWGQDIFMTLKLEI